MGRDARAGESRYVEIGKDARAMTVTRDPLCCSDGTVQRSWRGGTSAESGLGPKIDARENRCSSDNLPAKELAHRCCLDSELEAHHFKPHHHRIN